MRPIKSFQFVGQTKLHWLLLILLCLAACGDSTNNTPPSSPTTVSPVDLGIPAAALNSPVTGTLNPNTQMKVTVFFKLNHSQQDQLQQIAANQLNLEKEANKIGITDAQYEQIKSYFGIQNITLHLSKLHTSVEIDGTAQTMSQLFQTSFVNHKYQNREFYAPKTPPQVLTQILQFVVSITGLDSYSPPLHTRTGAQAWNPIEQTRAQANCTVPNGTVLPQNVAHAYGYDQLIDQHYTGKGLTINLIEIDGYSQTDAARYGACVGYRGKITVKTIGPPPSQPGGETALDINMIQGLAPDANIVDYQTGDSRYLVDELQQLIDDNTKPTPGNVVSISLGGAENLLPFNFLNAIDQELNVLTNTEHMTVFIASGDCGAFTDGVFKSLSTSFPANDPYAVAVGGTTLQTDDDGNRTGEAVWSNDNPDQTQCNNTWGSGGGNSVHFPQPNWQTGRGVKNNVSLGGRQVPDIAAIATNLPVYFGGRWVSFQGTSAATPIWAAGMALVNQATIQNYQLFFVGPAWFYHVANQAGQLSPYYDITEGGGGTSATFNATSGWDFATGLGAPNLVDFYKVLEVAAKSKK